MPLIKSIGNFTRDVSIITVLGSLVGAEQNISPSEEKQKAARTIPRVKIRGCEIDTPRARPIKTGIREMSNPKIKDANISPRMMVGMVRGQDINLSRVSAWVSQGVTMGDIEVEVKNKTIARSPGIRKSMDSLRPTMKERKRKRGSRIPNITTGPLE